MPRNSNQLLWSSSVRWARRLAASAKVSLAALTLSLTVAAQGTPADKAAAEALFQQGQELMDGGRFTEACEKFQASQQLDAGLGTMLYLADCYEQSGKTASAWAVFEEAASLAASRGETNREKIAHVRAEALKPRLTYMVIRGAERLPADAVVERDGRPIPAALFGVDTPVDPGTVSISVSAPGFQMATVTAEVVAGATQAVEVTLPVLTPQPISAVAPMQEPPPALTSPYDSVPATPPSSASNADLGDLTTQETLGLALGGAGLVALGVSAVFTVLGNASNNESLGNCDPDDDTACDPDGVDLRNDALNQLAIATVLGVAGTAALGAGIAVYVSAPTGETAVSGTGFGLRYSGVW